MADSAKHRAALAPGRQLLEKDVSAAFRIPCLPESSPEAPSPPALKLTLHEHQKRALHRCLLIEQDGSLAKHFNLLGPGFGDFSSRGGVLADSVGMGKTAMAVALILSAAGSDGPTLVVAPGHLIRQWEAEIKKFTDALPVLVGLEAYTLAAKASPSTLATGRHVVLIDVKEVLHAPRLWYDFRRVFKIKPTEKVDHSDKKYAHRAIPELAGRVHPSAERMQLFIDAAKFCVHSPKGGCSYEGCARVALPPATTHAPHPPLPVILST